MSDRAKEPTDPRDLAPPKSDVPLPFDTESTLPTDRGSTRPHDESGGFDALDMTATDQVAMVDEFEAESITAANQIAALPETMFEAASIPRRVSDLSPRARMRSEPGFETEPPDTMATAEVRGAYDALDEIEATKTFLPDPRVGLAFDQQPSIDAAEAHLRANEDWNGVIEHYLGAIDGGASPREKAQLLFKIAAVFAEKLGDEDQAFDAMIEAIAIAPEDAAIAYGAAAAAERGNRWDALFHALDAKVAQREVDAAGAVLLLEHMMRWATVDRGSLALADAYAAKIRAFDPNRPSAAPRRASMRPEDGGQGQREALERSLKAANDPRDRCKIHILLAENAARKANGATEALAEYQKALALDPNAKEALIGIERAYRELDRFADLEAVLLSLLRLAEDDEERIETSMRLAIVYERHFIKPQQAATTLQEVLRVRPGYMPALTALERCLQQMRAWPELARTLEERAAWVPEGERLDVVERIADVYESKLEDLNAAAATWARVLTSDEMNERALGKLARLREKVGDWQSAATYRTKLAAMARTPLAASKIHVAVGELLAQDDRDRGAAMLHFERAIALDERNNSAWQAFEREARRAGDAVRIARCLEERAAHSESPRERAQHLAELGGMRREGGDDHAALAMQAHAFALDPRNERAAAALLEAYVRVGDWANAAAPCQLLLAASIRDRDDDKRFDLLQTTMRIAVRSSEPDRALEAAAAAFQLRPRDRGAREDLIATAYEARANRAALDEARAAIARLAEDIADLAAEAVAKLAEIQRALGDGAAAEASAKLVLDRDPRNVPALEVMAGILADRGDFAQAAAYKVELARTGASGADASFALLVEAGDMWMQRAQNPANAIRAYEEALAIKRDRRLLYTLVASYTQVEDWPRLVATLGAIADLETDPAVKTKVRYALAQAVRDKLGDSRRAASLFDEVIAIDPSRLDAFEPIVRAHTEAKDWPALERAYRKMISKVKETDVDLRCALFHQLGLVYRDRMGRRDDALEAFNMALRIKPDSEEDRKIVVELLVVSDRVRQALDMTRASVRAAPQSPAIYADLYDLSLRARKFDRAWCAVDVLALLTPLDEMQARFHQEHLPRDLTDFPTRLAGDAWRSHLLHAELDPALTAIFAFTTQAIARAHEERRAPLGDPFDPHASPLAQWIAESTARAAEILGLPVPRLFVRAGTTTPFVVAMSATPSLIVSLDAASALPPPEIPFLIGKRLAEQRPELSARALLPTVTELSTAVAAAVRLAQGEPARDAGAAAIDAALAKHLTNDARESLRRAVAHASSVGTKLDVKRWSQLADLSSTRAGLLLAGTVDVARRAMLREAQWPTDLAPRDRTSELFVFAVSDAYAQLRAALGLGVDVDS